jgi:hypothetical protein
MANMATISVIKLSFERCFRVMLEYDDGDVFFSAATFLEEGEAEEFARTWSLENIAVDKVSKH